MQENISRITDLDQPTIKWRLTECCDYQCSYCIRRLMTRKTSVLEEDIEQCKKAVPYLIKIIDGLTQRTNQKVKIDLIGGEVSLLNLKELLDMVQTENLNKINITTNLSVGAEYFLDLAQYLSSRNITFSLCCSFHPEFTDLDSFFYEAVKLKDKGFHFKVETVITEINTQVDAFIERAEQEGISYMAEEDLKNPDYTGKNVRSSKPNVRYHIYDKEGNVTEYRTRNEFILQYDYAAFPTTGYYCSRDYAYVYIEKDTVFGNSTNPDWVCKNVYPIEEYSLLDEPRQCNRKACTLCGHINLDVDKERLMKTLRGE